MRLTGTDRGTPSGQQKFLSYDVRWPEGQLGTDLLLVDELYAGSPHDMRKAVGENKVRNVCHLYLNLF
jgi:hypothetical protein